jgi:CDP-glycerol glycerophosphotransferase
MMKLLTGLWWLICRLFPVKKNKIVISSYYGRGYSDSPKAIADELLRRNEGLDIVWLTDNPKSLPEGVRAARYSGLGRIYELSTAKVWIDNCRKGARFKKSGQIYMQTWHGFALKRIEKDVVDKLPDPNYEAYAVRDSGQTDLIVSNSAHMTEIYKKSFWYSGEVAEFGSPRNDVLFRGGGAREKVRRALGIDGSAMIVLYAPTFRVDHSLEPYRLDDAALVDALEARFGGRWVFVTRLHPNIARLSGELNYKNAVDATMYDDIQELLSASDAIISDYSSVIFDFALTGRPCFQYAADIDAYRRDRNFYIPLDKLPFPLSVTPDELCESIRNFNDGAFAEKWKSFAGQYGIIEDGQASRRCADWILEKIK